MGCQFKFLGPHSWRGICASLDMTLGWQQLLSRNKEFIAKCTNIRMKRLCFKKGIYDIGIINVPHKELNHKLATFLKFCHSVTGVSSSHVHVYTILQLLDTAHVSSDLLLAVLSYLCTVFINELTCHKSLPHNRRYLSLRHSLKLLHFSMSTTINRLAIFTPKIR